MPASTGGGGGTIKPQRRKLYLRYLDGGRPNGPAQRVPLRGKVSKERRYAQKIAGRTGYIGRS